MGMLSHKATNLDSSEHRYFPRWEVKNKVVCELGSIATPVIAYTKDLSCAGACLCPQGTLASNQKIKLTVYLSESTTVDLHGTVVWSKNHNQDPEVGVSFYNTTEKAQKLILKYAFNLDKKKYVNNFYKGWEGVKEV